MTINAYLNFNGNCREAFEFYRSVFGGEYQALETFANGPADMKIDDADKDKIMHVSLPVGSSILMGSDMPAQFGPPRVVGDNFSLSYSAESREAADSLFARTSDGGKVTMPMQETFWGAYFGACTDRFGVNWQFIYEMAGSQ